MFKHENLIIATNFNEVFKNYNWIQNFIVSPCIFQFNNG